jgi:hypothetical protein
MEPVYAAPRHPGGAPGYVGTHHSRRRVGGVPTSEMVRRWRPPRPPTCDTAAGLLRFAVLRADGQTAAGGLVYLPAMELRVHGGGTIGAAGRGGAMTGQPDIGVLECPCVGHGSVADTVDQACRSELPS